MEEDQRKDLERMYEGNRSTALLKWDAPKEMEIAAMQICALVAIALALDDILKWLKEEAK